MGLHFCLFTGFPIKGCNCVYLVVSLDLKMNNIEWLEPWYGLTEQEKPVFEKQLRKEITAGHPLAGVHCQAVGKNGCNDDVLFRMNEGELALAVVHLVWNGSTDNKYPRTQFYKNWQDFVDHRMEEDNFGYKD
jgi:hypothetical protein